ncbi:phage tail fiber protein [Buttiauxella noackiae ATCC 51607]|uniref:Phage tail fiber protein n=1 Tax=Buttiauxella noackiae ATCC 51607 TaxID=1354255 RepID=A0A1B7HT63_9ENTR|nr:phage tail protein [Buttiauxella noackiae]OAT18854.1 phage tail fiber protein [Buttiauxella noackiae ATCC 51607]
MTVKYKTLITTAGAAKFAAATAGGTKVTITQMAVGDGGGTLPVPDVGQTKLISEKYRAALNKISVDAKKKNYVIAELVIPPEVGGFWLREMGLYDAAGTLVAVANMAESYKPELAEGSGRAQTLRMVIIVSAVESVDLVIDTTMVMATQDYVDDKIAEHEQSRRHPDASLTAKGLTQLSSATDSASEVLAATPKAVKAAYDLANGKYTAQDATTARKGLVQLSSATDSTSEVLAATPKAVKTAYDLANGKYTAQDATTARKGIVQLSSATDSISEVLAATPKAVKAANDNANGRVPSNRKINGHVLTADANLTAEDVGALSLANGGTLTGGIKIKYGNAGAPIRLYQDNGANEYGVFLFKPASDTFAIYPTAKGGAETGNAASGIKPFTINLGNGLVSLGNGLSIGTATSSAMGSNSIAIGDSDTGFKWNNDGNFDVMANAYAIMNVAPSAINPKKLIQLETTNGSYISGRTQNTVLVNRTAVSNGSVSVMVRQEHTNYKWMLGGLGNSYFGFFMNANSHAESDNSHDMSAYLTTTGWYTSGTLSSAGAISTALSITAGGKVQANTISNGAFSWGNAGAMTANNGDIFGTVWASASLGGDGKAGIWLSTALNRAYARGSAGITAAEAAQTTANAAAPKSTVYTKTEADTRFQPKGSYTPAGEAYTKAASDARYLQGTKLGAEGHIVINSSGAISRVPAGCVMTGWQPEGQNIGGDPCYYKPIQQNINGTWATITG